jgi:PAS domain S-box-containing protein
MADPVDKLAAHLPLPLRILMVEDDANDAELLHAYLAEAVRDGAELLHARSLAEGLRLLESHEVHLTLLDLDLPDSSGFHTLEDMRAAAAGPVIVISGNGHPSFVQEVLRRRAYDVIPKSELDAATLRRILRLAGMHQEASRALRSTEERFRTTFEHAAVGLAHTDIEGRVMLANERLCQILGYPREELVGLNFRDLSHPEDRDASAALRASLHRGETQKVSLRKRYLRKSGETVWAQLTLSLVRDAQGNPLYDIAALEDVSEAVRVEQKLQNSERRFRALIDNSAEGIVLMDRDGRILYGSPATSRILGYTESDTIIGSMGADLVHADSIGAFLLDLAELRGTPGAVISTRTRLRHKDGGYRLLEGTWTNMLEEPSVGALVANFRDVTQKEQSLRQLAEAEARYRNLAESSPDAILVHAFGEVLYVNPACVKLLHAQGARDLVGRDIRGIVDPRDLETLRARLARLGAGEHQPFIELRWLRLDGSVAPPPAPRPRRSSMPGAPRCRWWRATSPSGASASRRCARARSAFAA